MRLAITLTLATALSACGTTRNLPLIGSDDPAPIVVEDSRISIPVVSAVVETTPVRSTDDAADDPAIWINPDDASASLILGTDKLSGVHAYTLEGEEVQFLPLPQPNNIDVRQGLVVSSETTYIERWEEDADPTDCAHSPVTEAVVTETVIDLAVTSNRGDNSVSILTVDSEGLTELGRIPTVRPEPYGICLGMFDTPVAAVTHENGYVDLYGFSPAPGLPHTSLGSFSLGGHVEGCVFDEANGRLFVGKEDEGIIAFDLADVGSGTPTETQVDVVDGDTGLRRDIEGLTIYETTPGNGYLIASSQGNDSFAVYDRQTFAFLGRFTIGSDGDIDGVSETDGIDATSALLNEDFPIGLLVVQDGVNDDGNQNFKLVPWQHITRALGIF